MTGSQAGLRGVKEGVEKVAPCAVPGIRVSLQGGHESPALLGSGRANGGKFKVGFNSAQKGFPALHE